MSSHIQCCMALILKSPLEHTHCDLLYLFSMQKKLRMNYEQLERLEVKNKNRSVVYFTMYIYQHGSVPTFTGVTQHRDPALTHTKSLLTEPGQLQQNNNSERLHM